ncbi:PadR family transcriptional regulator [Bacillus pinisoli]|uniref:PadR family transcriptional regulator n=1 Tax=Bacillus pinisoli TaxID=2901866 RepID=UPI001FF3FE0E
MKRVLDVFHADLHGHSKGKIQPFNEEYRPFFSKLVSVRDHIKYVILKELLSGVYGSMKKRFYVKDMRDQIKQKYGWDSSVSYIYDIARLMEEKEGFLKGIWVDSEGFESNTRHKRLYELTEEGANPAIFQRISSDVANRVGEVREAVSKVLSILEQKTEVNSADK